MLNIPENVIYGDIFGHVDKQIEAVKVFKKILREREILLNT